MLVFKQLFTFSKVCCSIEGTMFFHLIEAWSSIYLQRCLREELLIRISWIYYWWFFCTNMKHENYLQMTKIKIKIELEWLELESWKYLINLRKFLKFYNVFTKYQNGSLIAPPPLPPPRPLLSNLKQGTLKGEVSLYHWPPVWLVCYQLYDNWQFFVFICKTD